MLGIFVTRPARKRARALRCDVLSAIGRLALFAYGSAMASRAKIKPNYTLKDADAQVWSETPWCPVCGEEVVVSAALGHEDHSEVAIECFMTSCPVDDWRITERSESLLALESARVLEPNELY